MKKSDDTVRVVVMESERYPVLEPRREKTMRRIDAPRGDLHVEDHQYVDMPLGLYLAARRNEREYWRLQEKLHAYQRVAHMPEWRPWPEAYEKVG